MCGVRVQVGHRIDVCVCESVKSGMLFSSCEQNWHVQGGEDACCVGVSMGKL